MLLSVWGSGMGGSSIRSERLTVLLVDDEVENVELLRRVLHRHYNIISAHAGEEGIELLRANPGVAVVITDQRMPGLSGVALLREAVEFAPDAIRIIVSGYTDTQDILDAINLGHVDRFIVKPVQVDRLANTVKDALEVYYLSRELEEKTQRLEEHERTLERLVSQRTAELEAANARLAELALRDGLTGLYNHRYFHERLQAEIARARRHEHDVGLLFLDIDHFKQYNDAHGHPSGDELLKGVATILVKGGRHEDIVVRVRQSDVVARYGGEEFAIILPETPLEGALVKAQRIRETIASHPFDGRDTQPLGSITVSVGIAAYPGVAPDATALIRAADRAMYEAKQGGRNRVCTAPTDRS